MANYKVSLKRKNNILTLKRVKKNILLQHTGGRKGIPGTPVDYSLVLKLDQGIPQTISGGQPIFDDGLNTSEIILPPGGQILLTIPTNDGDATGIITNAFNSGYSNSSIGDLVYLDLNSTWQKVDNGTSTETYSGLLGIALEVKSSGNILKVALPGSFIYSSNFPTLTIGAPIYMSDTGSIIVMQPSESNHAIRVIGYAVHVDKIFFNPSSDYIVHI